MPYVSVHKRYVDGTQNTVLTRLIPERQFSDSMGKGDESMKMINTCAMTQTLLREISRIAS